MEKLVLLLGITVLVISIFKYFKLPSIIAYLLIGCFFGPYGFGFIEHSDQINFLAEIGVVFLLFTIGLELPLSKFVALRYHLALLGGGQVFLSTLLLTAVMYYGFDIGFITSLVTSSALSLSSTAIIIRQLSEQNELFSKHGQFSFAMLIFQDLAVVPLLVLLPIMAKINTNSSITSLEIIKPILLVLFKGAFVFLLIIYLSKFVFRYFFYRIASTRSLELFMFSVLFVALLSAMLTHEFGLSMSFGAFVAGVGLGESEYRHQIDAELRPFRDIFLGIFFISIGSVLDFHLVVDKFGYIIQGVLALIITKLFIITLLCYLFAKKLDFSSSIKTGLIMSHAGEFSLAILTLASNYKIIGPQLTQVILAIVIISLFIAVLFTKYASFLSNHIISLINLFIFKADKKLLKDYSNSDTAKNTSLHAMPEHYPEYQDHIIICGFGRVGRTLGNFLKNNKLSYIALEQNSHLVKSAAVDNYKVYLGDASRRDVLAYASLNRAKLVVICIDNDSDSKHIVSNIRSLNSKVPILVRTHDMKNYKILKDLGADEVIAETVEASLMLVLNTFTKLGIDPNEGLDIIKRAREENYNLLETKLH